MKKYYKVVQRDLTSARASNLVIYKIGEYVSAPKNTRLFVFETLQDAKSFASTKEIVFECSVQGGIKFKGCGRTDQLSKYWFVFNKILKKRKKIKNDIFSNKMIQLSDCNAVLVKKVKLDKQII